MIESKNEKDCLDKGCFTGGSDILEAAELLYEILNASYVCSGTCLEREINGHRETIRSLYWNCKERMEQIAKGGEKTEFLSMSVLEHTFNQAYTLLLVRLEDIAEGNDTQPKAVRKLKQIFKDNPYKALWKEKTEQYGRLLEGLGFRVSITDYSDLTAIFDPLLDAFTLYQGGNHRRPPEIHRVRTGTRSGKRPEIGQSICKYRSEKELVDAVAGCGRESVIVFGAVEKTNRQVTDGFHEWYYGYPEERQRNFMGKDHITAEEYLNQVWDYSRRIYLCVKSGETIWLMAMPYQTGSERRHDDPESKYYYGRRAGYAPYEIFYKDLAVAESDTTFLSVPRKGYYLSELMDEQQKVWFPVFIEETVDKFFRSEPDSDEWILPEEIMAVIPGSAEGEKKSIVPVITTLPSTPTYVYEIKGPGEMFQEAYLKKLFEYFKIGREEILTAPILPAGCGTRNASEGFIEDRVRKVYRKVLADRIARFLELKWEVRGRILDWIHEGQERIIAQAAEGMFDSFMSVVVDGTPETDKNGNPVMRKSSRWPYRKMPAVIHTTSEDYEEEPDLRNRIGPKVLWVGPIPSGKAPVVWKIRPGKADEYGRLFHMPETELPDMLRLSGGISRFYEEYEHDLPRDMVNEWTARGYGSGSEKERSVYLPPLGDINICMTKRTYKKYIELRGKDHET